MDKKMTRVVFMGSGSFALKIFSALIEDGYDVVSLYTNRGKKSGVDSEDQKTEIRKLAEIKNIAVHQPSRFGDEEIAELKKIDPDLLVVAAYGKILPEAVLDIPKFGALNVHGSLLPKLRGPSPIQNAILNGDKTTGSTIMLMDKGIDTGMIIRQEEMSIGTDETYPELMSRMADMSAGLLLEILPDWMEKKIKPTPQNEEQASLCQLIERSDGRIIWADDAGRIYDKYRAFQPWPGIFTFWEKGNFNLRLKLNKISVIRTDPEMKRHAGEVFEISDKIGVGTGLGVIILEEVQLEGKGNLRIGDFINGNPDFIGSVLR
jgi:methionyl-tRNA formyltransferase